MGSNGVPSDAASAARANSAAKAAGGDDSYTGSVAAKSVAQKVAQLKADADGEVREDIVVAFSALMGSGALDTPDAAERAASAMLRG